MSMQKKRNFKIKAFKHRVEFTTLLRRPHRLRSHVLALPHPQTPSPASSMLPHTDPAQGDAAHILQRVTMARTGSGTTAVFPLLMLQRLRWHVMNAGVCGLVLSPTRDSAMQTAKFTRELGYYTGTEGGIG